MVSLTAHSTATTLQYLVWLNVFYGKMFQAPGERKKPNSWAEKSGLDCKVAIGSYM